VGKPGYLSSNFVCADLDGCYMSLRNAIPPDPRISTHAMVESTDIANPDGAFLFGVVRHMLPDGTLAPGLNMPLLPADYAYSADEITRIKAWITAGAKND
jgi:hypothetical protein